MMFETYRQMVTSVQDSYTAAKRQSELRTEPLAFMLYRPLSFWITPFFLWAGCSANAVTTLGLAIAFGMPLAAVFGANSGCILVTSIALIIQVLDCVDGNIARTQKRPSKLGKMLDGICTLIFWVLYFITVGILVHNTSTNWIGHHGLEIGLGIAVLFLVQRELEDTYDAYFQERVRFEPPLPKELPIFDLSGLGQIIEHSYAFIILPIAHITDRLDIFIATIAVYQVVLFMLWIPRFVKSIYARTQALPLEPESHL